MTVERIEATAFPDPQTALETALGHFVAALAALPADQRHALALVADFAKVAALQLAQQPIAVSVAWPSGVPQHVRVTLAAQLRGELQRVAQERLRAELDVLLTAGPHLASLLATWMRDITRKQAAAGA